MLDQLQIGNQFANKNKQTTVTIEDANTKIKTCLTFILCESWRHKWLLKVPLDAYPCKKNTSIIMTIHLNYFIKKITYTLLKGCMASNRTIPDIKYINSTLISLQLGRDFLMIFTIFKNESKILDVDVIFQLPIVIKNIWF